MFTQLIRRLSVPAAPTPPESGLALAALLVRLARADGVYAPQEMAGIDRVLVNRLGLSPFAAAALRTQGEALEAASSDMVRFTRALKEAVPLDDRADLMQSLWAVALADGDRAAEEDQVMRMTANLLGLSDRESALARQRAERAR